MKYPRTHRAEGSIRRSGRLLVNPYCVEEVGLTPHDLARDRAAAVVIVVNHQ
jgi:hypothetical protein